MVFASPKMLTPEKSQVYSEYDRDVAQSGSAPEWGSGGREFKSHRPDHVFKKIERVSQIGARSFLYIFYSSAFFVSRSTSNTIASPVKFSLFSQGNVNLTG